MDQCDIPDTFLTPCFLTLCHKLNSLVHSLPQLLFSVTPIFARVIFSNPKINSMHISYMYERRSTAHEMKKSPCCWECIKCSKEGHCEKKWLQLNHVEDCEIFSHKPSSKSVYVTVLLNNEAQVQLQIDTGASCNILPQNDYIRATGNNQCKNLERSYTRLIMPNKSVVWPLGEIRLLTERKKKTIWSTLPHSEARFDTTPLQNNLRKDELSQNLRC